MNNASRRPSSHRLMRLTELRERANVSQVAMARACGLTGSQSRLTAGAWETGKHIPRPEVRPAFISYLWNSLDLKSSPEEFRALWAILVEEWGWAKLNEQEWRELQAEAHPSLEENQALAEKVGSNGLQPVEVPTEPLEAAAPATSHASISQAPARSPVPTKQWLAGAFLALCIGLGLFFFLERGTSGLRADGFNNLDFEAGDNWQPWMSNAPDECELLVTNDAQFAQHGERYLALTQITPECHTLSQQAPITTTTDHLQRFAIWLRPLQSQPVLGQIVLHTEGDVANRYESIQPFLIPQDESWHCVEVALQLPERREMHLSAELILTTSPTTEVAIDAAQILPQRELLCPLQPSLLVDGSFEDDPELTLWEWISQPCIYEIENGDAQHGSTFLRITRQNTYCQGMVQQIPIRPTAQPVRLALWTRAAGENAARMSIRIGRNGGAEGQYQQNIKLASTSWRCHELQYTPSPEQLYLALSLYLWGGAGAVYDIDHLQVSYDDKQLCPPAAIALDNGNFEDSIQPGAWEQHGACSFGVAADPRQAHSGDQYLFAARTSLECFSIYQDILTPLTIGERFTARLWIRSANRSLRNGFLTLWALGEKEESTSQQFSRVGPIWRCVKTTLTIANPAHHMLRIEVYLDNDDGIDYYFDDAIVMQGADSTCPPEAGIPTPRPTKAFTN